MSKIYFTSDQHHQHINICGPTISKWESGYRNFSSLQEMEDVLVENTNSIVGPEDIIYDLGDICMGQVRVHAKRIMDRFNCKNRHLLFGNHDGVIQKKEPQLQSLFLSCQTYLEITYKGILIVMHHYPIASWHKMGKGALHAYGHSHGSYLHYGRSLDVGVDVHNFKPILIDDFIDMCQAKDIVKVDHHGE